MGKSKFVAGALLGAVAALLLTPVTGKKTRASLKKAAKRAGVPTDRMEGAIDSIIEKGSEMLAAADGTTRKKTNSKK